jgi:DNA-binding transcriptional MerR regulator
MQNAQKPLTIGKLSKRTNTPFYKIQYLDRLGLLEKKIESTGKGNYNIYRESAIEVIFNKYGNGVKK